jgi:cob(I)alamin adenosyltransferase
MTEKIPKGLIQIYTGDGKGKTTAALGLAIRATGQGMKVIVIQFIKGVSTGEQHFAAKHHHFDIVQLSVGDSFTKSTEQLKQEAQQTLVYAEKEMLSNKYDIVILDEIFVALGKKLISIEQVQDLLDKKPESVELVLTGRNAPKEIIQRADLATEMLMIKHPFNEGVGSRRGIEY